MGKLVRRRPKGEGLGRGCAAILVVSALAFSACTGGEREIGGSVPAGAGSFTGVASAGQLPPAPRKGYPAPDFVLPDLEGNPVQLSSFRGQPVLINFWTTWCPPCRAEMPDIEIVYQRHKDKGLVVLGVDVQEDKEAVQRYIQRGGFSWKFLLDSRGEVFFARYRGAAYPSSFFVDAEGVIQEISIGALNEKGLESKLAKILP